MFAAQLTFAAAKKNVPLQSIENFKVKVEFLNKSDAIITETITINTPQKSRTFRDLPKFYKSKNGSNKEIRYDIISLRRDGANKLVYIQDNVSYLTVKYPDSFSIPLLTRRPKKETRTYEIVYKITDAASLINLKLPKNTKGNIITFNKSTINNSPENKFGGLALPFKKDVAINTYPKPFTRTIWLLAINNMAWIYLALIFLLVGFHLSDLISPKADESFKNDKSTYSKAGLISSLVFLCLYQFRLFPPHNIGAGIITNNITFIVIILGVYFIIYSLTMAVCGFIVTRFNFIRMQLGQLGQLIVTALCFLIIVGLVVFTFVQLFINISNAFIFAIYFGALCVINPMLYYIKPFILFPYMEMENETKTD